MIIAEFFLGKDNHWKGFRISGHSGYSDAGSDIVCASVSSAAMLTANTITDSFFINADVLAEDNMLKLEIKEKCENSDAHLLINALYEHLDVISQEYSENINVRIINTEV